MKTTNSTCMSSKSEVCEQLRQVKCLKWILNINSSEQSYTYDSLHKQINEICNKNYTTLIIIYHYLSIISPKIMKDINRIINNRADNTKCKKLYFSYIKKFKSISEYKEYQTYIYIHRSRDVMNQFTGINEQNFDEDIKQITNVALKKKSEQLALIYNILSDKEQNLYVKGDIMENLPQLIYWIKNNAKKPIETLTNDECEILAGLIYELDYDTILNNLHLSSKVKDYKDIDNVINKLPQKFHVNNITQAIFRIIIAKPYIWQQLEHEDIVNAIHGLSGCIF